MAIIKLFLISTIVFSSFSLQAKPKKTKLPNNKYKDIQNQQPYDNYDYDSEYEDSYENYEDDKCK